jgi:hypothetical protein
MKYPICARFFLFCLLLSPFWADAQKKLIVVHVIDKKLQKPAGDVEVWSKDAKGNDIFHGKTNPRGDVEFPTDVKPGKDLEIRVLKNGTYVEKTQTHGVKEDPNQNKVTVEMVTTAGNKTTIRVFSPKSKKPLEGARVCYKNHVGELECHQTNNYGEVSFPVYFPDGTEIDFSVEKMGYNDSPTSFRETLKIGGTVLIFDLARRHKFSLCNCFLIGAGVAAGVGTASELSSRNAYSDYKDFTNGNRESDYSAANNRRRTAIVSGVLAVASIVAYPICKKKEEQRKKAEARKRMRRSN